MAEFIEIESERLYIRQWRDDDFEPFARMNSDARVMEFFPSVLSREESDKIGFRCKSLIEERGWGFWALEEKNTRKFIGFTGLHTPQDNLPFSPCVEIGWRLSPAFWGQGLATEAAKQALRVGFEILNLDEIVSFAVVNNYKSLSVMERLNMVKDQHTFEHPCSSKRPHAPSAQSVSFIKITLVQIRRVTSQSSGTPSAPLIEALCVKPESATTTEKGFT